MIHRSQGQSILELLFLSAVMATLALLPTQVRAAPGHGTHPQAAPIPLVRSPVPAAVPETQTIPTQAAIGDDRPIAEALQVGMFASGYQAGGDATLTPTPLPPQTPTPAIPGDAGNPILWWIFPPAALAVAAYYLLRLLVKRLAARFSARGGRGS